MEDKIRHDAPQTVGEAITIGLQEGMNIGFRKQELRGDIAYRVKALRIEKKLTQDEMACKINVNTLTYRGYENCKSDIPLFLLIRIADVLQVSLDYITGRTDVRQISTNNSERSIEQRLSELERLIANMKE